MTYWPLLEYDEDAKRYVAAHHPFTSPKKLILLSLALRQKKLRQMLMT
ncbi:hypothetical protein ACVPOY_12115 [Staphylococcus aureus]